jgi:hypothetical protein
MKEDADAGVLPELQVLTSRVIGRISGLSFRALSESLA